MKKLRAIDIIYENAPDAQKTWIELTDKYWLRGGFPHFKKAINNHVELSASLADEILKKLPKNPKVIADIGAGWGGVAINLALKGIKVLAIEPNASERKMINYFKNLYPEAKKNISVINAFAEKLPIAQSSVDLCILSQVLEHVSDPKMTFKEISRVLKTKGYLHLSCPNYLFPAEQHYKLPHLPLMSKKLFAAWTLFLLKTLNIRNIKNPHKRDFSMVYSFINYVNYTTDNMVKKLCLKNNLKIIWSAKKHQENIINQIFTHWKQNPRLFQIPLIIASLPIKIARSILAAAGILPMKLEYLIQKK